MHQKMEYKDALNKSLALVLWAKDENGEDDVVVFSGVFVKKGPNYYLLREGDEKNPEIRDEWLSKIKSVPEDLKETLMECDYQLSLSVGNSEEFPGSLESYGLKWPE